MKIAKTLAICISLNVLAFAINVAKMTTLWQSQTDSGVGVGW